MAGSHPEANAHKGGCAGCLGDLFVTTLVAVLLLVALVIVVTAALADAENLPCEVSDRFPSDVLHWCGWITASARKAGLPPDLVAALIWQESGGNPKAYSHSGAVGLMQVMPRDGLAASFRCKGEPCFSDRPASAELYDPEFNIRFGTRLLAGLVKKHQGDIREALREYGPMDMGYRYADIVLNLYLQYGNR